MIPFAQITRSRLLLLIAYCGAFTPVSAALDRFAIRVGPNVLVSRDGDVPHVETTVAINPVNPRNLVGAAITVVTTAEGNQRFGCRVYASSDGGFTWTVARFPELISVASADPQVSFGPDGTAYYVTIVTEVHPTLYLYSSEDGGKNWSGPIPIGRGDHGMLAVDGTSGKHRGRIYVSAETAEFTDPVHSRGRKSRVVLYYSKDGGRSFESSTVAETGGAGLMAESLLIFGDGSLAVPMREYPNPAEDQVSPTNTVMLAMSSDGGGSFSPAIRGFTINRGSWASFYDRSNSGDLDTTFTVLFAVDQTAGPYRDRLYAAWNQPYDGRNRVVTAYSVDRGQHWSLPKLVDPGEAQDVTQYQPKIEVNNRGAVGITWFQTGKSTNQDRYSVFFAASLDGGNTFGPAVRVSSRESLPAGAPNLKLLPSSSHRDAGIRLFLMSAFSRYRQGGEYTGMVADSRGRFHPFWPDSRTGTFQVWTTEICVDEPCGSTGSLRRSVEAIDDKVSLVFDSSEADLTKQEVTLWVRIRNISPAPICRPVRIELKGFTDSLFSHIKSTVVWPTEVMNASNQSKANGALFDYSGALGGFECIEPGALTEALPWRLKFDNLKVALFPLKLEVTGSVAEK